MAEDTENGNQTFVRVTNKDIWEELKEIRKLVEPLPEDRKRLRSLELKVYSLLSGFAMAMVAGAGVLLKGAFK